MTPPPAIILIRPQMGENIGAAARAMSNFGLQELRLVAPRDGWPNAKAFEMATESAESILHNTTVYDSFAAALADIHVAYATTARPRDLQKPVLNSAQAVKEGAALVRAGQKMALVFGPERSGLTNEEIVRCDAVVSIPTSGANASLNLAQSVVILGYEWVKHNVDQQDNFYLKEKAGIVPATKSEWDGLFSQMEKMLDACNYFRTSERKVLMWRGLRNIFARAPLNTQEIRTLRGMFRSLARLPEER